MSTVAKTAVVTDSTADIPPEELQRLRITVVPAILAVDGNTYQDGVDLSRADLYRRMAKMGNLPTTAAPSPVAFQRVYEELLAKGSDLVLSIHISPKLSGILQVAAQAAREFGDRVRVVDSGQVSLGLGFQVMEAAAAALRGDPMEKILEVLQRTRERVRLVAAIDTLEYLRRSGRVNWIRASLGDLLQVKVVVQVLDGVIERLGQVRTRHRAIDMVLATVESWGPLSQIAVIHSAAPDRAATLAQCLKPICARTPVIVDVTTAIGAHVGPGSVGVVGQFR